jgi:hypothetical protein
MSMARFEKEAIAMFKADKPQYVHPLKFSLGDDVQGVTDDGIQVLGRISAIGETTYRVQCRERAYTIQMDKAQVPYKETSSEEKTDSDS